MPIICPFLKIIPLLDFVIKLLLSPSSWHAEVMADELNFLASDRPRLEQCYSSIYLIQPRRVLLGWNPNYAPLKTDNERN